MNATSPKASVELDVRRAIKDFLYREARLLDMEQYDDWLAMLAPDIRYWIPTANARYRRDGGCAPRPSDTSHMDDRLPDLQRRIKRFQDPSAWAEDPPTRHCHVITNIEIEFGDIEGEFRVYSAFVNCRGRFEAEDVMMMGRRIDIIRQSDDGFLLAGRTVMLTQNVLLSRNISTFL